MDIWSGPSPRNTVVVFVAVASPSATSEVLGDATAAWAAWRCLRPLASLTLVSVPASTPPVAVTNRHVLRQRASLPPPIHMSATQPVSHRVTVHHHHHLDHVRLHHAATSPTQVTTAAVVVDSHKLALQVPAPHVPLSSHRVASPTTTTTAHTLHQQGATDDADGRRRGRRRRRR